MEKAFDVVALGELLIDFTEHGLSEQGNPLWEANPGGAPCNVLAMLNKLGRKTAFIGKVGSDVYGRQLIETVTSAGIDTSALLVDPVVHTTLAVVHTFPNGDRDFSFYRDPGADMMLRSDELPLPMLQNCRIFHFGTLSMTHEGVREATVQAVQYAKACGALVSFDPNLRPPLWNSLADARTQIGWGLRHSDIVKIADNELEFLTGETDFDKGAAILKEWFPNIRMLNVTAGPDGSYCYYEKTRVYVPAFLLGGTIETTGAGDTFCACVLHDILTNGLDDRTGTSLTDMLRYANAAAYLVTTKKGALRVMPSEADIQKILH